MPSPVNGSTNPAASPTRNQPGPARRATRFPIGRRARDRVLTLAVPPAGGVVGGGRDVAHDAPGEALGAIAWPAGGASSSPSTIPTFTRPPGTGAIPT